jgi:hypothetical protein
MRNLKDLLSKKHSVPERQERHRGVLDEKTVFHIAKKVLVEEYGIRGGENIIPTFYKEKKLFLSARSSLWGNEIWLERDRLKEKMNTLLGDEAIEEIKMGRD